MFCLVFTKSVLLFSPSLSPCLSSLPKDESGLCAHHRGADEGERLHAGPEPLHFPQHPPGGALLLQPAAALPRRQSHDPDAPRASLTLVTWPGCSAGTTWEISTGTRTVWNRTFICRGRFSYVRRMCIVKYTVKDVLWSCFSQLRYAVTHEKMQLSTLTSPVYMNPGRTDRTVPLP